MGSLITIKDLRKQFGSKDLFHGLSLVISEQERMGILGPNGAGKSTFLKILAGQEEADSGDIIAKRGLNVSYVKQTAEFDLSKTALELAMESTKESGLVESEQIALAHSSLGQLKLIDFDSPIENFSGGQKKRLQIALGLCEDPDLLLLDEPTNHLDIASILELEDLLNSSFFAWVMISHDRSFLENTVKSISEINPRFQNGIFTCKGNYSDYRRRKDEHLKAEQKQRGSLESKVRDEKAWLRQGAKARSTKSKSRIDSANSMIDDLSEIKSRQQEKKVKLSFTASERKTKELAEFHNVSKAYEGQEIFKKLSIKIKGGQSLGILGLNGTGKSTFVKLLSEEIFPDSGTVKQAAELKISHFRQFDDEVSSTIALKNFLAVDGDSVVFRGNSIHVASWARRFQFPFEQLEQPVASLSGGEKARARIARLMLDTPDILILDEPTNDLDIETLEVLEESLEEFSGALVLVSHDRFLINKLCNSFLGLDGEGGALVYADYQQWEREVVLKKEPKVVKSGGKKEPSKKSATIKLSYQEQKELAKMEKAISKAESKVATLQEEMAKLSDASKMELACKELAEANEKVASLYARWEELEQKSQS